MEIRDCRLSHSHGRLVNSAVTKKVKNSPVYTYDYPVHDYENNSVYLVIYCNGKNIKSLKNEDAQWLLEALKIWESPEDIQALLSSYHY